MNVKVDSTLNSIKSQCCEHLLVIDSVKLGTLSLTYAHSSNILTVNMNRTYNPGEIFTIKIYYRHNNVTDNGFYSSGGMVFTDAEPEGAERSWFPLGQSF